MPARDLRAEEIHPVRDYAGHAARRKRDGIHGRHIDHLRHPARRLRDPLNRGDRLVLIHRPQKRIKVRIGETLPVLLLSLVEFHLSPVPRRRSNTVRELVILVRRFRNQVPMSPAWSHCGASSHQQRSLLSRRKTRLRDRHRHNLAVLVVGNRSRRPTVQLPNGHAQFAS